MKGCWTFEPLILGNYQWKPKIDEDQWVSFGAKHDVWRIDVPVDYLKPVESAQSLQERSELGFWHFLHNLALFHGEEGAVVVDDNVESQSKGKRRARAQDICQFGDAVLLDDFLYYFFFFLMLVVFSKRDWLYSNVTFKKGDDVNSPKSPFFVGFLPRKRAVAAFIEHLDGEGEFPDFHLQDHNFVLVKLSANSAPELSMLSVGVFDSLATELIPTGWVWSLGHF